MYLFQNLLETKAGSTAGLTATSAAGRATGSLTEIELHQLLM